MLACIHYTYYPCTLFFKHITRASQNKFTKVELHNSGCVWTFCMKFGGVIGMDDKFFHQKCELSISKNHVFAHNSAFGAQKCYLLQGHIGHILPEIS